MPRTLSDPKPTRARVRHRTPGLRCGICVPSFVRCRLATFTIAHFHISVPLRVLRRLAHPRSPPNSAEIPPNPANPRFPRPAPCFRPAALPSSLGAAPRLTLRAAPGSLTIAQSAIHRRVPVLLAVKNPIYAPSPDDALGTLGARVSWRIHLGHPRNLPECSFFQTSRYDPRIKTGPRRGKRKALT